MDKISNNSACVIGVIALIAVIPRYIQLPNSLELLFHDMIGQLLLLLLAITVGSYNFTCGLLLVVLFLSIMLQSKIKSKYASEGFIDYEEGEDKDMELNENFDTATKKTKKPSSDMEEEEEDVQTKDMEEDVQTQDMEEESMPTKMPIDNGMVDDLKQELRDSQKKIKDLEAKMKKTTTPTINSNKNMNYESEMNNTTKPTINSNKKVNSTSEMEMQMEMQMQMEMEKQNKKQMEKEMQKEMEKEMEMEMKKKSTQPPTFEGFECDYTNDNRRTQYVKLQEAEGLIETFQNQSTQQPRVKVESDCYDLAGCKYQNGYTPFNDTFYGPPVDSCHAYRKANVNATGTLFYPLN
jgi:hypothetical protein